MLQMYLLYNTVYLEKKNIESNTETYCARLKTHLGCLSQSIISGSSNSYNYCEKLQMLYWPILACMCTENAERLIRHWLGYGTYRTWYSPSYVYLRLKIQKAVSAHSTSKQILPYDL